MSKYYSSERLKEIIYTNKKPQDLFIYDRKNQDKIITLIHDMDLEINNLQENNLSMQEEMCLRWNELDNLKQRINKTIKYCEESSKTIKSEYFSDVLKILKGEE